MRAPGAATMAVPREFNADGAAPRAAVDQVAAAGVLAVEAPSVTWAATRPVDGGGGLTPTTMLYRAGSLPSRNHAWMPAAVAYHRLYWQKLTPAGLNAARAITDGTYSKATHAPVSVDVVQEAMRLARARWGAAESRALMPYEGARMVHVPYVHGHVVLVSTVEPVPPAGDVFVRPDSWVVVDGYASFEQNNFRALLQWPGILLQDPTTAADPELAAQTWEAIAPSLFWTEWSGLLSFPNASAICSAIESVRAGYEALLLLSAHENKVV